MRLKFYSEGTFSLGPEVLTVNNGHSNIREDYWSTLFSIIIKGNFISREFMGLHVYKYIVNWNIIDSADIVFYSQSEFATTHGNECLNWLRVRSELREKAKEVLNEFRLSWNQMFYYFNVVLHYNTRLKHILSKLCRSIFNSLAVCMKIVRNIVYLFMQYSFYFPPVK
jgi:hypothetical protein